MTKTITKYYKDITQEEILSMTEEEIWEFVKWYEEIFYQQEWYYPLTIDIEWTYLEHKKYEDLYEKEKSFIGRYNKEIKRLDYWKRIQENKWKKEAENNIKILLISIFVSAIIIIFLYRFFSF